MTLIDELKVIAPITYASMTLGVISEGQKLEGNIRDAFQEENVVRALRKRMP